MTQNMDYKDRMSNLEYSQLINILNNQTDYTEEAISAARAEIENRQVKILEYQKMNDDELLEIYQNKVNLSAKDIDLLKQILEQRGLSSKMEKLNNMDLYKSTVDNLKSRIHENRYPVLTRISFMYYIMGWIVSLITAISVLIKIADNTELAIMLFIGGAVLSTTLFLISEVIKLFLDIEKNTRISAVKSN
jgi:hypothetical protein